MTNHITEDAPARDVVTISDILEAIEADGGWLTREERLHAPVETVEAELAERGGAGFVIDEGGLLAAMRAGAASAEPATEVDPHPYPVPRSDLLADLRGLIADWPCVLVTGASGSGKSYLINALLSDADFREDFPRLIHVDCAALRMADAVMFGREAAWAHFGSDDDGYKRFLASRTEKERDCNALTALMEQRLTGRGVLVLDHAEKLNSSNEIDRWLTDQLLRRAAAAKVKVVIVHRTPVVQMRAALRDIPCIDVPPLSAKEFVAWLDQPGLSEWRNLPLAAIAHFTGGRPTLVRDFALFLSANMKFGPKGVLRAFVRWRSREGQFLSECERLIRAAREFPEVIERVLRAEGLVESWSEEGLTPAGVTALLASGAVRRASDGRLELASPLYTHRLRRLSRPDALSGLAVRTDFQQIETTSSWKTLRRFGELASDALAKALGYESSPTVGLQRLSAFLLRWEFRATIFVRDPDNGRLWAPFDRPDRIGPLECWRQPDFARAAQTGQVVRAPDGRIFVPVISYTGNATMVIIMDWARERPPGPCTRRVDVERVTGVIEGIQPTLAQLVQRMVLRRDRKLNGKLWYKSKTGQAPAGEQSLLRQVGCRSIVVLELRPDRAAKEPGREVWLVSRFQRTGEFDEGTRWTEGLSTNRLTAILRHPSGRGLVLSGQSAIDAFPRLTGSDATLYCHPVVGDGRDALVIFLFGGESQALDGYLQSRLSVYAPELLKVA